MVQYPNSIPIAIQQVVASVNDELLAELQEYDSNIEVVQFMCGNEQEILKTMKEYTEDPVLRTQKFPVVILIEDIVVNQQRTDSYGVAALRIIIANSTQPKYSSMEREPLFQYVLRPIYHSLRKHIYKHKAFNVYSERQVTATQYIEHKYWGRDENRANQLGDYIDAIDLIGLNLSINWKWCEQTINQNL